MLVIGPYEKPGLQTTLESFRSSLWIIPLYGDHVMYVLLRDRWFSQTRRAAVWLFSKVICRI